jgi:hypothetical protein
MKETGAVERFSPARKGEMICQRAAARAERAPLQNMNVCIQYRAAEI